MFNWKHLVKMQIFCEPCLKGNITWTNNLPYVILGSLVVDTNATLTIEPGCKIYSAC